MASAPPAGFLHCLRSTCSQAGCSEDLDAIFCPPVHKVKGDDDLEAPGGAAAAYTSPTMAPAWAVLPSLFQELNIAAESTGVPIKALARSAKMQIAASWRAVSSSDSSAAGRGSSDPGNGPVSWWQVAQVEVEQIHVPLLADQQQQQRAALPWPHQPTRVEQPRRMGVAGSGPQRVVGLASVQHPQHQHPHHQQSRQPPLTSPPPPQQQQQQHENKQDEAGPQGHPHRHEVVRRASMLDSPDPTRAAAEPPCSTPPATQQQPAAGPPSPAAAASPSPVLEGEEAAQQSEVQREPQQPLKEPWGFQEGEQKEDHGPPLDQGQPPPQQQHALPEQPAATPWHHKRELEASAAATVPPALAADSAPAYQEPATTPALATQDLLPVPLLPANNARVLAEAEVSGSGGQRTPHNWGGPLAAIAATDGPPHPVTPQRLPTAMPNTAPGPPLALAPPLSPLHAPQLVAPAVGGPLPVVEAGLANSPAIGQGRSLLASAADTPQTAGSMLGGLAGEREVSFHELRLGPVIGEGGFGKVYLGDCRGRRVAIKVLTSPQAPAAPTFPPPNPHHGPGMAPLPTPEVAAAPPARLVQEFAREAVAMLSVPEHPNVLKLVAVCTTPPLALVTEYCAGGSLYGLLHSPNAALSWAQVARILQQAAAGMAHLHRHGVLHRDLKSANLLLTSDLSVRVADFGLARLLTGADRLSTMTGGLGTYQWMAPEVLANQRYSSKADVYSFGVVVWEMCARQVPYEGMNGVQAALAVVNRGLRPEIPGHTPPILADLIRSLWAPVPEQRPTFDQVVEWLGHVAAALEQHQQQHMEQQGASAAPNPAGTMPPGQAPAGDGADAAPLPAPAPDPLHAPWSRTLSPGPGSMGV